MSRFTVTTACGTRLAGDTDEACKLAFRAHDRACDRCRAIEGDGVADPYGADAFAFPGPTAGVGHAVHPTIIAAERAARKTA